MSWALATDVAIWTLILGSLGVFGWFVAELVRLARSHRSRDGSGSGADQ